MRTEPLLHQLQRAAAGFVVIVVGVMVALAADEWLESWEDESRQAILLERLADELRTDSISIEGFIAIADAGITAIERLIVSMEGGLPVPDDSLAVTIRAAGTPLWPQVQLTTYVEMTSTGGLALLPDSVRAVVVEYHEFINWVVRQSPRATWEFPPWSLELPPTFGFDASFDVAPERLRQAVAGTPESIRRARALGIITNYHSILYRQFLGRASAALATVEAAQR